MRHLLLHLFIISIIACQGNSDSQETNADTTAPQTITATREECFRKILARDTFSIKVLQTGDAISGDLEFDNYEKDSSHGTIKGEQEGDTLKLWYEFESEGMHSVMEIYFKRTGGKLVRGVGTMDVKGDTSYFTNPSDIKFEDNEAWEKVECEL